MFFSIEIASLIYFGKRIPAEAQYINGMPFKSIQLGAGPCKLGGGGSKPNAALSGLYKELQ
jgi:hypothetical protein